MEKECICELLFIVYLHGNTGLENYKAMEKEYICSGFFL